MNRFAPKLTLVGLTRLMAGLFCANLVSHSQAAQGREGVALVIVLDNSGSMLQTVRGDAGGRLTPKHVIADRAYEAVLDRLTAAAAGRRSTHSSGPCRFQGDGRSKSLG